MTQPAFAAVLLAAGKGTRMYSARPKVMHAIANRPMVEHVLAALASLGIWFEIILMQLLVRHIYDKAATSAHVRYALTEIEDECRHSKMFARLISRGGTPYYPVSRTHLNLGRVFKTI